MAFKLRVLFRGENGDLKKSAKESKSSLDSLKQTAGRVAGAIGAAYAAYAAVSTIVDVTKRYQTLNAQLLTSTGSMQGSAGAFAALSEFARRTGQDLDSTVTAFTRLTNLGLTPSQEAMEAYGNVAAATGKSTIDFVEAVADASTAEFERLKEFGIKAKNQGDTVAFTFRGMTTEVANNAEAIEQHLISLGQNEFAGAMENQAQTLEAQMNRAKASFDDLVFAISDSGASDVFADMLGGAAEAMDEITGALSSGQITAHIEAWLDQFQMIGDAIVQVSALFDEGMGLISEDAGELIDFLAAAASEFPANIEAVIKILATELTHMVTMGKNYAKAFVEVIVVELAAMADKAGAYGKELIDNLAFWEEETFDLDAELARIDSVKAAMNDGTFREAERQANAAREARLGAITAAMEERQAVLDGYEEQTTAANNLRATWEQEQQALRNTDLGQFKIDGGGEEQEVGVATQEHGEVKDSELEKIRSRNQTEREELIAHHNELQLINQAAYEQGKILEDEYLQNKSEMQQEHHDRMKQFAMAEKRVMLNNYGSLFGEVAGLAKAFGGEQSKTYRALFAVSKAFAIAEAIIKIQQGVAQAASLGFPLGIPAMATVVAQSAGIVSTIKGTSMKGQAHDGISRVPASNEGTWMLKRGEMVLNNKQRDNFEDLVDGVRGGRSGGNVVNIRNDINIDARGASEGTEGNISDALEAATEKMKMELAEDFASGGPLARQLKTGGQAA